MFLVSEGASRCTLERIKPLQHVYKISAHFNNYIYIYIYNMHSFV